MKLAHVTLVRDDQMSVSSIITKQYVETVVFWKITWAPQHIIFHTDEADENKISVYRADRVYELYTEELES